jgi:hypothetical protein
VTQLARSRLIRESSRIRADIHDGPEHTLQSEAGYSNARPHQPGRRNLLHRTAGPYSRVIYVILACHHPLPVFPDQQTLSASVGMSQTCQEETCHPLDDLVGAVSKAVGGPAVSLSSAKRLRGASVNLTETRMTSSSSPQQSTPCEAPYCMTLPHDRVRSSGQSLHCRSSSNVLLRITAPRRGSDKPAPPFSAVVLSIDIFDWKDLNDELDC